MAHPCILVLVIESLRPRAGAGLPHPLPGRYRENAVGIGRARLARKREPEQVPEPPA